MMFIPILLKSVSLSIYVMVHRHNKLNPKNHSLCEKCFTNCASSIQLGDTSNVFFIHGATKLEAAKTIALVWTKKFESSCWTACCDDSIHIWEQRAWDMCNVEQTADLRLENQNQSSSSFSFSFQLSFAPDINRSGLKLIEGYKAIC